MSKVVLATGNQGKVLEMQEALRALGFTVLPQSEFDIPEAIEDGLSFVENAIKKARHACQLTGLPAIADDSGLEVDALDGAPGIYSSRYADGQGNAANNAKLLRELTGVTNRQARFQCVIVYLQHAMDPTPIICQGCWEGEIADQALGDQGFGYDPLFYIPELGCHAAQLTAEHKRTLSHRGQALAQLKLALKSTAFTHP
ncbi:MAG: RdgB/HAM1 family non-canonical purine NTP pyrophosphatase [Gammaproteobacteria bacterium]|nr:RdgB/HAM1 family non-canonical purine NTP pyrophosphatase [Gammaproteobacteria bacterium]